MKVKPQPRATLSSEIDALMKRYRVQKFFYAAVLPSDSCVTHATIGGIKDLPTIMTLLNVTTKDHEK